MTFSNFNLVVVNLWIGLCRGTAGLPRFFREHGYVAHYIEHAFTTQAGKRVCPEIVVYSQALRHTILIESKSGANTEADQLQRYAGVTSLDLQRKVHVPADACDYHDCAVIGLATHAERLQIGIEGGAYSFPLLAANDAGLALVYNAFRVDDVSVAFTPQLALDWTNVPMQFVPVNPESYDWEIAETVMPVVLEFMNAGETQINTIQICIRICTTWGLMGPDGRKQMVATVDRVLESAASAEFEEFFTFRNSTLRIVQNPRELDTPKTAQAYRTLLKAQQKMLSRMHGGQLEIPF